MNELSTQERQLPDTLEDLAKFTLIGRERLNAVRAEIRAIEKVGLAKEVHEQKLAEAQEIAEAVLDAETQIGKLTAKIPKGSGGDRKSNEFKNRNGAEFEKTKSETLKEAGIKQDTAERFERLAKNPEAVEKAKEDARSQGRIVTRQDVFKEINAKFENQRQEDARKLREAKERRKEFESYLEECAAEDADNIVSFNSIKQNNDDKELIFQDFNRGFESAIDGIRSYAGMIDSGRFKESIEMANKYELERLADHAQQLFRAALKIQKVIMEVADEK